MSCSISSGSILPCNVRMESSKFEAAASIVCFSYFQEISKRKAKHQILRNSKLQSLAGIGLKLHSADRCRNTIVVCSSVGAGAGPQIPSSPTPNPGSWKPWFLGILVSVILPILTGKMGPLLKLIDKVDTVVETIESVTDIVENVAEKVEHVVDEIGDRLPEGKLKDALEHFEDLAENTAEAAHKAGELIDKVDDMIDHLEEKVESFEKSKESDNEKANEKKEDDDETKPKDNQA